MKKILSILLLTLCLTGCGETTVSYKASKSHSATEPSLVVPTYSIDYNDPSIYYVTDDLSDYGVSYFRQFIKENGYYNSIVHQDSYPRDIVTGDIKMVSPEAVLSGSNSLPSGVYIYSVNDGESNYVLYNGAAYVIGNGKVLQAGLWDYDNNGTPDLFLVSQNGNHYFIIYLNLTTHFFDYISHIFSVNSVEPVSFHFDAEGFYINDSKLTYADGLFSCPPYFENDEGINKW